MLRKWGAVAAEVEPTPPVQTIGGANVAAHHGAEAHHELLTKTSTPYEAISHASQRPEAGLEDLGQRSGAVLARGRAASSYLPLY